MLHIYIYIYATWTRFFEAADYGIVGDLFQVAPLMVECAKKN